MPKQEIRDAATLILIRDPDTNPRVLMGQRGAKAAFMPNKFVFPGGAVDRADADIRLAGELPPVCAERIGSSMANALAAAAIRELWEEAGLTIGTPGAWGADIPQDWQDFAGSGLVPTAEGLRFVFRAITPPGRPRRFDARFFAANANIVSSDLDNFSKASDELSFLEWLPIEKIRHLDLPFITEVVLAEIAGNLPRISAPESVPFFNNTDEVSLFERIGRPLGSQ